MLCAAFIVAVIPVQGIAHKSINVSRLDGASRFDGSEQSFVPPGNDNFVNATVINGTSSFRSGTVAEATKEVGEPNHAGNPGGHSVWFRWTAPAFNCSITFTTGIGSNFNTLLAVYTGASVASLTTIVANDNYGVNNQSQVTFPATANAVYQIAIDGFGGQTGSYNLDWFLNDMNVIGSDFDRNGFNDFAVFRPSNGTWYANDSGTLFAAQWGQSGDVPVPSDYDGDERTDVAIWRPASGTWYVLQSFGNTLLAFQWGQNGDKPCPGDYFAEGNSDFCVFRPSNGTWYVYNYSLGTTKTEPFGQSGDQPVPLDYDGDGRRDFAVFRPSTGVWYIRHSSNDAFIAAQWGQNGDIPVPGDYTAEVDGKADLAVFRPSTGVWYIRTGISNSFVAIPWGVSGDIPQPSSFFGASSNLVVFRPSNATWYIRESTVGGFFQSMAWGANGDIPVTSCYVVGQ